MTGIVVRMVRCSHITPMGARDCDAEARKFGFYTDEGWCAQHAPTGSRLTCETCHREGFLFEFDAYDRCPDCSMEFEGRRGT